MASANLLEHARLTYHKNDHFQLSSQSPSSLSSAYILIGPQLKLYPCACWGLCTKDQPPFHISISCQENSYMMCLWPEYLFHFLPFLLRDSRKRRRFDSQSFTVFTSLVSGLSNLTKSIPQPFPPLPSNFDKPQVAEKPDQVPFHSLYIPRWRVLCEAPNRWEGKPIDNFERKHFHYKTKCSEHAWRNTPLLSRHSCQHVPLQRVEWPNPSEILPSVATWLRLHFLKLWRSCLHCCELRVGWSDNISVKCGPNLLFEKIWNLPPKGPGKGGGGEEKLFDIFDRVLVFSFATVCIYISWRKS